MRTPARLISGLLAHLKRKPGDKQARARLYGLGYKEPKPSINITAFDQLLREHYKPEHIAGLAFTSHPLLSLIKKDAPLTVHLPSGPQAEANARKLGYGVAYVVVKRDYVSGG